MTRPVKRLSPIDLVEAFHLGHAVAALQELDAFPKPGKPVAARQLARKLRLDPAMLAGMLEYVAARTTLLKKGKRGFTATADYSAASRFLLDLYLGAFGGTARQLPKVLRDPSSAPRTVDRKRHARAFERIGSAAPGPVLRVVEQLGLNHVLDIGCGSAALLLQLAARNPDFLGWGLETNPSMRKVARRNISAAKVGKRVRLLAGGTSHRRALNSIGPSVQAVTACQVANEMFSTGTDRAVAWLRQLKKAFPGRPLLVSDYYGRLGRRGGADRMTLLHDFVQLTSGQGVPPSSRQEWQAIYSKAGCRLVHAMEARGSTWFVHIVAL
jgi:SAM-dependent methyltransferase